MDTRVKLQAQQVIAGAMGDVTAWVDVATVWASIKYQTGAEFIRAGAPVGQASVSIKVNRRAGLSPQMRVQHGAKLYEVLAVLPDEEERIYTFLVCRELQS